MFHDKGQIDIIASTYEILPSNYNANTIIYIKIYHSRLNRGALEVEYAELLIYVLLKYYRKAINIIIIIIIICRSVSEFVIYFCKLNMFMRLLKLLIQHISYTFVINNRAIGDLQADLWLMLYCCYAVIGNSAFACWCAWLVESMGLSLVVVLSCQIDTKVNVTPCGCTQLIPT